MEKESTPCGEKKSFKHRSSVKLMSKVDVFGFDLHLISLAIMHIMHDYMFSLSC